MSSCSSILASLTSLLVSAVRKGHLEVTVEPAGGVASFRGFGILCFRSNKTQVKNEMCTKEMLQLKNTGLQLTCICWASCGHSS